MGLKHANKHTYIPNYPCLPPTEDINLEVCVGVFVRERVCVRICSINTEDTHTKKKNPAMNVDILTFFV